MRNLAKTLCGLLMVAMVSPNLVTADEDSKPPIEYITCQIVVSDPEGNPVEDAMIRPAGFRTLIERGSHWGWVKDRHGPIPKVQTNETGRAKMEIPKYVAERLEIGEVSLIVEHSNFVVYYGDHKVADNPITIKLEDGYRVAATVIDKDSGQPITTDIYGVMSGSRRSSSEWTLAKNGTLVSSVVDSERTNLRIVHLPDDQPAQFSELIDVAAPEGSDTVFLRQISVSAGTRMEGHLDAQVPRPVTGGHVTAYVSAGLDDPGTPGSQNWRWFDKTEIKDDGSFVFASLPRGEVVQLVAVCDGWLSREPNQQEIDLSAPWVARLANARGGNSMWAPLVYMLNEPKLSLTIEMVATATVEVKVVKPDGSPLPNANVSLWPNQFWLRGGSTIVGVGFRSADLLRSEYGRDEMDWLSLLRRFEGCTNEQGVATITNLPGKPGIGLGVEHDTFDQPIEGRDRSTTVALKSGETHRLEIKMQPKGTDLLGR